MRGHRRPFRAQIDIPTLVRGKYIIALYVCRSFQYAFCSTHALRIRVGICRHWLHQEITTKGGPADPNYQREKLAVLPQFMLQSSYTRHRERVLCHGLHW